MVDGYVLLVEDNPDDEMLILRTLRKYHLANEIKVARDGAEALQMLMPDGGDDVGAVPLPELVLLDLQLPKISGLDVLARIRENERTKNIAVVILTSSDEESDIVKGYGFGTNSYICKPVDFGEFSKTISQVGMYWLALNRPMP